MYMITDITSRVIGAMNLIIDPIVHTITDIDHIVYLIIIMDTDIMVADIVTKHSSKLAHKTK